jgi:tRNA A37 threonylcarbamoyladenosine dehydratase
MSDAQERTRILLGQDGLDELNNCHVAIVGLGGVGGAAAEAVARAGIGRITLVDHDRVGISNINRQVVALHSTLGQPKAEAMAARLRDINPDAEIHVHGEFLQPYNIGSFLDDGMFDYVLDCIDSVACKAVLVADAQSRHIPLVSSLGAGGRLDVTQACITTLKKTHTCGLACNLRRRLRKLEASLDYPVVFSPEVPIKPLPQQPIEGDPEAHPRAVNGTISYMPNLFGFMLAGYAIKQLINQPTEDLPG